MGELGGEVARLGEPETPVLSHDPQIPFAAGMTWVPLPTAPFEDIVTFAKNKQAPLIIFKQSDRYMRDFTLEDALARSDLVDVLVLGEFDGERVAIFQVRNSPQAPAAD